jgi:hypothetical protein
LAYIDKPGIIEGYILTCKVGSTAANAKEVAPLFKGIGWNPISNQGVRTAANQVMIRGYHQGHKHIEGELRVASQIGDVMYVRDSGGVNTISGRRFINPGVKNDECLYFVLTVAVENLSGTQTNLGYVFADPAITISGTASTVLWDDPRAEIADGEEAEWVYPFKSTFLWRSGA